MRSAMDSSRDQMSPSLRERPHRVEVTSTRTHRQPRESSVALLGMSSGETSRTESVGDTESLWSPREAEAHHRRSIIPVGEGSVQETEDDVAWDEIPWMEDVIEKEHTHPAMLMLQAGCGLAAGIVLSIPLIPFIQWVLS